MSWQIDVLAEPTAARTDQILSAHATIQPLNNGNVGQSVVSSLEVGDAEWLALLNHESVSFGPLLRDESCIDAHNSILTLPLNSRKKLANFGLLDGWCANFLRDYSRTPAKSEKTAPIRPFFSEHIRQSIPRSNVHLRGSRTSSPVRNGVGPPASR